MLLPIISNAHVHDKVAYMNGFSWEIGVAVRGAGG
jgi:hypothetical protein